MLLDFLKPSLGLRAHLAHPCCRAVLQSGMIFVLPRSGRFSEGITLLPTLDFFARYLRQEGTAATPTGEFVDVGNHVNRQDDVRSSAQIPRHTPSVT